ncbi:MAG TPA: hypothetical protein VLB27_03670, partial [candidate division Zixibacteria bacterium]|nr:hypothetical protein [candidate division Zixibacteria bacterium]
MNTIHPYAVSTRVALALVCAAAWALTLQAAPTEPDSAQLSGKELQAAMLADREQAKKIAADNGVEWCQTHIVYEQRYGDRLGRVTACPPDGDCDLPGNRNASIPDPGDPELVVRLKFNVFRNDDGSNPAATQQDVDDQVVQLNSDFSPSRIMFEYETEFID